MCRCLCKRPGAMNSRMSKSKHAPTTIPTHVDYWRIFRDLPFACLLFEANDLEFTIVDMNRERERQDNTTREKHIGHALIEDFPSTPDEHGRTRDKEMNQAIR